MKNKSHAILIVTFGALMLASGCNSNTPPSSGEDKSQEPALSDSITTATSEVEKPVDPWTPGLELFPGEYILIPDQTLQVVRLSKIPQMVTLDSCDNGGCFDFMGSFPSDISDPSNTTAGLPYEFWPDANVDYPDSHHDITTPLKFTMGFASRYDITQPASGEFIGTINTNGIETVSKTKKPKDGGIIGEFVHKETPQVYQFDFTINTDWDNLSVDSANVDWSRYGLQLKGLCLDFYLKPNDQFFHRVCQPLLRYPRSGKFTLGFSYFPEGIDSVWVAARPYIDDEQAKDYKRVYNTDDVYGVWNINLQDIAPQTKGSIAETCNHVECLPEGSTNAIGFNGTIPIPILCPNQHAAGGTVNTPQKYDGHLYWNENGGQWSFRDDLNLFGSYSLAGSNIDHFAFVDGIYDDIFGASGGFRSFYNIDPKISLLNKKLLEDNTTLDDRAISFGRYDLINGTKRQTDEININLIENGFLIFNYRVNGTNLSGAKYGMLVGWRYQCSK